MGTEVEARFRAGEEALRRLATVPTISRAALGPPEAVDERDTYLDTAAGALAARGWACRLRRRGTRVSVSLKGPAHHPTQADGLERRPEIEAPGVGSHDPNDWPPSEARALVDQLREDEPLVERLSLRQRRVERRMELDGSRLGTLSLDTVEVEVSAATRGRFHVVELELGPDALAREAALSEVAAALRAEHSLEPDGLTKLERAFAIIEAS